MDTLSFGCCAVFPSTMSAQEDRSKCTIVIMCTITKLETSLVSSPSLLYVRYCSSTRKMMALSQTSHEAGAGRRQVGVARVGVCKLLPV